MMTDQLQLHSLELEAMQDECVYFQEAGMRTGCYWFSFEEIRLLTENIYDVCKLHILGKSFTI